MVHMRSNDKRLAQNDPLSKVALRNPLGDTGCTELKYPSHSLLRCSAAIAKRMRMHVASGEKPCLFYSILSFVPSAGWAHRKGIPPHVVLIPPDIREAGMRASVCKG